MLKEHCYSGAESSKGIPYAQLEAAVQVRVALIHVHERLVYILLASVCMDADRRSLWQASEAEIRAELQHLDALEIDGPSSQLM